MTQLSAQAYTVAWLCALPPCELVVATAMLDEEHLPLSLPAHDDNSYFYGSINGHNVVVACMPPGQPGKVSASKLVQPLSQSFPNLKIHLFVGIGGGVPRIPPPNNPEDDIHLGDVVIGWAEQPGVPGVVQWDLIKYLENGNVEPLGMLDKPDRQLLNALGLVLANRIRERTRFPEHLERLRKLTGFSHPGLEHDKLFKSTYHHVGGLDCSSCNLAQLTERPPRVNQDLIFHQGTIVSGDAVMKDPWRRNEISRIFHDALCFEMEAAGVMDDKRCLIIRGIADYADSHNDGSWQNYAAGTAAAFAREFLFTLQPQEISGMESAASLYPIPKILSEDQKACLQSLSFPEIDFRKNDVVDPIAKTCKWLTKHRTYLRWLDEHRAMLWLKGKPGAGKSTLLKYALMQQRAQDMLILASFFFHGRGLPIQRCVLGFFRSLLFQILQQIPDLLSSCSTLFKRKCDTQGKIGERWEWQARELQELFKIYILDAIKTYSVHIFIDALDECGEDIAIELVDFFQRLMDELPDTKTSFRVFFSCRHYPLVALENGLEICVQDENREDIEKYVCRKLNTGIQDETISEKLLDDIIQRSSSVFQWVVLVVPQVIRLYKKGKSLLSIQTALQKIPSKLNELYQELLRGIDDDEKPQSLQLMQWVCFAQRPLLLEELRFAIAVDAYTSYESLSQCQATEKYTSTDEEMKKRINDLSRGLAELKVYVQQPVVQFVHQSVRDYLIQDGLNVLTNNSLPGDIVGSAHFRLSRSCLRYMSMKEVVHGFQNHWRSAKEEFPFLNYATNNWVVHAKEAEKRHISQRDLLGFFTQPSGDALQPWIFMEEEWWSFDGGTSSLLPKKGHTSLHVASRYGFCDVVRVILDAGDAEPNCKDCYGRSPLSMAAANGHEAVVKMLLEHKDIAPDLANDQGCAPLLLAAENGHTEVVSALILREDVDPNSVDDRKCSSLHKAASHGHVEVVKLLLRKDVNPDSKDWLESTPLNNAASCGHIEVVKLLLARKDVDPGSKDEFASTPLHKAASHGHVDVAKLLLRENVNPNSTDDLESTPLDNAARCGQIEVVKLLLAQKYVNLNSEDDLGSTPLHKAASHGCIDVVQSLLARRDIKLNAGDNTMRTPLHEAASRGHVEVVKLLLERKDLWPNSADERGSTPLHEAASRGHIEIVRLLLTRQDLWPNSADERESTPLHEAASRGHVETVRLLLTRQDLDPNLANYQHETPLYLAALFEHIETVKLLLDRTDIELESRNQSYPNPMRAAERKGHYEVMKLLESARLQQQQQERSPLPS